MALKTIRGRYTNGVIEPDEPLGFEDGEEVMVTFDEHVLGDEEEDAALARLIVEGMTDERVSEDVVESALAERDTPRPVTEAFLRSAGSWKGLHDDPDALIRDIYESRITGPRERPEL